MYFESVVSVKPKYQRKGVLSSFRIDDLALEADNVKIVYDDTVNEIVVVPCEEESTHYLLLSRVGFYSDIETQIELLLIDEVTFLISPKSGVIFVTDEEDESKLATIDVEGNLEGKKVYSSLIKWITPKYMLELIKSCGGGGWGELSNEYPYDYIYDFSVTVNDSRKVRCIGASDISLGNSKRIKCLGTTDISLGMVEKALRKIQMSNLKKEIDRKRELEAIQREQERREEERRKRERERELEEYDEDEDYMLLEEMEEE